MNFFNAIIITFIFVSLVVILVVSSKGMRQVKLREALSGGMSRSNNKGQGKEKSTFKIFLFRFLRTVFTGLEWVLVLSKGILNGLQFHLRRVKNNKTGVSDSFNINTYDSESKVDGQNVFLAKKGKKVNSGSETKKKKSDFKKSSEKFMEKKNDKGLSLNEAESLGKDKIDKEMVEDFFAEKLPEGYRKGSGNYSSREKLKKELKIKESSDKFEDQEVDSKSDREGFSKKVLFVFKKFKVFSKKAGGFGVKKIKLATISSKKLIASFNKNKNDDYEAESSFPEECQRENEDSSFSDGVVKVDRSNDGLLSKNKKEEGLIKEVVEADKDRESIEIDEDDELGIDRKILEKKILQKITQDPRDLENYRNLAELYIKMKNFSDAVETYQYILEVSPCDVNAKRKIEKIRLLERLGRR